MAKVGGYILSDLRLVEPGSVVEGVEQPGATILPAEISTRYFEVVSRVLVSKVQSRVVTLDEIRDKGIIIDDTSY